MNKLAYCLVYPFIWIVSSLPFSVLYIVSDIAYFFVYHCFGYRKSVVRKNLNIAFPEKSKAEKRKIERSFYHYMCDMFLEMIKAKTMTKQQFQQRMVFENIELIHDLENRFGSFFLMCGHYASYEWVLSLQYKINTQAYGIYTPITNKYFDDLIHKIRFRYGAKLISRYRAVSVITRQQLSKQKCAYGVIADQSPLDIPSNYRYPFLGVETPVFIGVERMSKRFDLPVVYCRIEPIKRGYYRAKLELITDAPNEFPDYQITDRYFERLEQQIRELPEYYLWSHNRFKHSNLEALNL